MNSQALRLCKILPEGNGETRETENKAKYYVDIARTHDTMPTTPQLPSLRNPNARTMFRKGKNHPNGPTLFSVI